MRTARIMLRRSASALSLLGIDVARFGRTIRGVPPFIKNYMELKRQLAGAGSEFPVSRFYPCLEDRYSQSGTASGHYFHQDLLVASMVFSNNPVRHVDVGSRVDGLVAHIASFRPIEVFDVRALSTNIPNIRFTQADITSDGFSLEDYCDSVSSLHVIEHLGLGRFGDRVDRDGHLKGLDNIHRMLKRGGKFYFSVPIGPQRIEFNGHRVFSLPYLMELWEGRYRVDSFSYVNDAGDLVRNAPLEGPEFEASFSCDFGCGIFEMTKLQGVEAV